MLKSRLPALHNRSQGRHVAATKHVLHPNPAWLLLDSCVENAGVDPLADNSQERILRTGLRGGLEQQFCQEVLLERERRGGGREERKNIYGWHDPEGRGVRLSGHGTASSLLLLEPNACQHTGWEKGINVAEERSGCGSHVWTGSQASFDLTDCIFTSYIYNIK